MIHNLKQAEIQVPSSWSEHANELRGIMDTIKDHTDHIESTRGSAARIRVIVVSTLFEVPMGLHHQRKPAAYTAFALVQHRLH